MNGSHFYQENTHNLNQRLTIGQFDWSNTRLDISDDFVSCTCTGTDPEPVHADTLTRSFFTENIKRGIGVNNKMKDRKPLYNRVLAQIFLGHLNKPEPSLMSLATAVITSSNQNIWGWLKGEDVTHTTTCNTTCVCACVCCKHRGPAHWGHVTAQV